MKITEKEKHVLVQLEALGASRDLLLKALRIDPEHLATRQEADFRSYEGEPAASV
jgi:hypothetical protein